MDQHTREVLDLSSARLAANTARLERSTARVRLAWGWVDRNQAELDRSRAAVEREARHHRRVHYPLYPRSGVPVELRLRFAEVALQLAETESSIARRHDALAVNLPDRAEECRRIAEQAREGARRAHKIADQFRVDTSGPTP